MLPRVPVTRVYDATPLDRLGVPVWAAVTPLARDLTVHGGKGGTPEAARLSAVMEAIERVSAETVAPGRVRRATFRRLRAEIGGGVLDPALFDLPFETRFAPDIPCRWVEGVDVLAGRPVWVARDLVVSPAVDGVCLGRESNGLAAGNTPVEAALHAVLELVERDADAIRLVRRRFGEGVAAPELRVIECDGLPETAQRWIDRCAAAGMAMMLEELPHPTGIPVVRATLEDPAFPGREGRRTAFAGLGADLDAGRAIVRAVSEAAQSHTTVLLGARDRFEGGEMPRQSARRMVDWLLAPVVRRRLADLAPPFAVPDDLAARLELVVARLRAVGNDHCVVVDLTHPDLGVPVVRALVPGLAAPHGESTRRPSRGLLRHLVA